MNTKHTPGPWFIGPDNRYGLTHLDVVHGDNTPGAASEVIARVTCRVTWLHQQMANARLIAAAPDLLEALKEADRLYSSYRLVAAGGLEVGGWICDVRAAIQKATGESA